MSGEAPQILQKIITTLFETDIGLFLEEIFLS